MPHTLVVGGTRGIGRAVVKALVGLENVVSVIARRPPEPGQELAGVRYWSADLLDGARLRGVLGQVLNENGALNYLICLQRYRADGDDWAGEMGTTLDGTRRVIDGLVDGFQAGSDDAIVLVSSLAGRFVVEEQPLSYHVAKAGLDQMVRAYAVTLGPRGIRVNGVSPGTVIKEESRKYYTDELLGLYRSITPLGRIGTAEDVARVIAFLCSPQASFVTGQNIVVDGGGSLVSQESLARRLSRSSGRFPNVD